MNKLARDDEEKLIDRSQRGDIDAFNEIVLQYQQTMYSTVFRLLGNADTAADVTQDAFIAAFRAIKSYRGGSSFRAWLLRIGSNMACDHWRRVQRQPADSLEALTEDDETHSSALLGVLAATGAEGNPEENLLTRELQELLQTALQQLPLDQRSAVILCDIQGLAYEEVAQVTQTTLGTVRSRISRGRARLRNFLLEHRELLPRDYRLTNSNNES
ncbi:sigma-70 family RNA polymerase sigma factor [Tengunoibacter tsumagoiensis]|uniref:RNA polymerase subunit sigma-24 n=1 Tax=Tengunoibacter tsumagoiensis TaxID=2014871 RepID=A0A402A3V7_9CHLR|nr:sigma-70 family RNA polymerase sigma factor [Tengunoibacter tsumagoiensis]GCE13837.1 RNA polymerase subunit sigma-24 [Tengunoibacter tsumagoiensis]